MWDDVKYCSDRCRGQRSKGGGHGEGEGEGGTGEKGGGKQSKSLTTPPAITKTALNPTAVGTLTPRRGFLSCVSVAGGGLAAAAILAGRKASNQTEGTNKGKNMAWIAHDETRFRPRAAQASGEQARRPGKGEIDGLLEGKSEEALWPEPLPPYVKSDFARLDETDDALFYDKPKVRWEGIRCLTVAQPVVTCPPSLLPSLPPCLHSLPFPLAPPPAGGAHRQSSRAVLERLLPGDLSGGGRPAVWRERPALGHLGRGGVLVGMHMESSPYPFQSPTRCCEREGGSPCSPMINRLHIYPPATSPPSSPPTRLLAFYTLPFLTGRHAGSATSPRRTQGPGRRTDKTLLASGAAWPDWE